MFLYLSKKVFCMVASLYLWNSSIFPYFIIILSIAFPSWILLENLYIVHNHIVAFWIFILRKYIDTFHEPFFEVCLCFFFFFFFAVAAVVFLLLLLLLLFNQVLPCFNKCNLFIVSCSKLSTTDNPSSIWLLFEPILVCWQ